MPMLLITFNQQRMVDIRPHVPMRMARMVAHAKRGSSGSSNPEDGQPQAVPKRRGRPPAQKAEDSSRKKEQVVDDEDILLQDDAFLDEFEEDEEEDYDFEDGPDIDDDDAADDEYGLALGEDEDEDDADDGEKPEDVSDVDGIPTEDLSYEELVQREVDSKKGATAAEVTVIPAEEIARQEAEAEEKQKAAMALPAGSQLDLNRQGYQAFLMGNVEFLVAETQDGKLDLRDAYVFDTGASYYARPQVQGALPGRPVLLQVIPWVERRSDDNLKKKAGTAKMKKVYFVGVQSVDPYRIAMDQVFQFDASSRVLSKAVVRTVGNVQDPVLRIRADGITIEDSARAPPPHLVATNYNPEDFMTEEEKAAALQERMEELEAQAEELDELDEQPDIPSTDMM
eukprot:CAMPEP_0202875840 /NCGR_PEP_ID=MMETSP1391-20130828/28020_1 /ASSEMBLY_ACC=CAM_ASM_000867 /TAXON_ID=1034604 /ORGANISM="Chlamydomonas leiostraca, Strain SAG 11-49" /LENGTH=396 /DNA_ID=CAMNT_0049557585 /DNA_START=38 /DNA_END=1229 /DNA_ORIENTATION=-